MFVPFYLHRINDSTDWDRPFPNAETHTFDFGEPVQNRSGNIVGERFDKFPAPCMNNFADALDQFGVIDSIRQIVARYRGAGGVIHLDVYFVTTTELLFFCCHAVIRVYVQIVDRQLRQFRHHG
jgi:hypothetical protein